MAFETDNGLPIFSQAQLAGANQRIDAANKAARAQRRQKHREAMPTLDRPLSEFSRKAKGVIGVGATALTLFTAVAVAESPTTARIANDMGESLNNTFNGQNTPNQDDATKITVGDRIRYTTSDGQILTRRVNFLSDITVAAEQVDPTVNYNSFNSMLSSQDKDRITRVGETVKVSGDLGIKDIGP